LEPQVQRTSVATLLDIFPGPYGAGTVENIAARLRGSASTGVVLLMAHYDSVATAPGATDDGSGVVTLLETLRVLKSGPPLRNDLIFLFTDGEELGEVGSQGFVSEHPWAKQVSAVWNLDSGGSCGAAGIDLSNGWALRKLRKVIPHPLASSIGGELDKLGPPEGDDTLVFNPEKVVIARSGYSGCYYRYHTAKDNVGSIDPRSVQHLGLYTLTVAREWGNANLGEIRVFPPSVFFVVLGQIISYPAALARAMSVLLLVFYSFVVLLGLKLSRLSVGGLAFVVLLWILWVFTCAGLTVGIWWALKTLHLVNFSYSSAYNAGIYATAFVILAAAGGSALYGWSRGKTNADNLMAGGLFWCLILSMLSSWFAPGISFLLSWPLLFGLISLMRSLPQRPGVLTNIFRLLCSFPAIFLLVPVIVYSISNLAGDPWPSLVVCVLLTILCLTFLAPQVESIGTIGGLRLSSVLALVGVGLLCWGALHSSYDNEHPRPDTIAYWLNADTGTTSWISLDKKPDGWTSQFLPAHVTSDAINIFADPAANRVLKADAPRIPLSAPQIVLLDDSSVAGLRKLRLRLTSLGALTTCGLQFRMRPCEKQQSIAKEYPRKWSTRKRSSGAFTMLLRPCRESN
jgi:hypothetical protein